MIHCLQKKEKSKLHLLRFNLDCTYLRGTCANPWVFAVKGRPLGMLPGLDLLAGRCLSVVLGLQVCDRLGGCSDVFLSCIACA